MSAIYLIRHGQASFGRSDYDKLSELGQQQATRLGEALRSRVPRVNTAITGDMRRHKQTAEACLRAMQLELKPSVDAGFNEFDHDELIVRYRPRYQNKLILGAELASTLRPKQAFQEMFAEAVARWLSAAHDSEYTESWSMFQARAFSALERLSASLESKQTAFVFTSAGTITAIFQRLLSIPQRDAFTMNWTMVNCGITKVIVGSRGMHLSSLNDHGHFEADAKRWITYR